MSPIEPYSAAATPLATAALRSLAPSRWTREPELARRLRHGRQLVERPHATAGAAMRLLEHDDARRLEVVRDAHHLAQLIGRDPAAIARQRMRDEPGVHRGASGFEHEHVRPLLGDQLAAPLRLAEERDLVRHRRGRQEERLLLAEEVRRAALELVDGRVLAELLVAHVGGRHRRAHLGRGLRGGVGAEIDHGAILAADGPRTCSRRRSPPAESRRTAQARSGSGPRAALPATAR